MIEKILAFVLGASSVFLIWGVVVGFKTSRKLKELQEDDLPIIYGLINDTDVELKHRIDEVNNRVDELYTESIKHTDSRVDKLESKLDSKINDILSNDKSIRFEIAELRQRINNIKELVDDIVGLNIKK